MDRSIYRGNYIYMSAPMKYIGNGYASTQIRIQEKKHRGHRGGKLIPRPGTTFCASTQWKRTWTYRASYFMWKFKEKYRIHDPQETFLHGNLEKNTGPHFQTPALCEPAQ